MPYMLVGVDDAHVQPSYRRMNAKVWDDGLRQQDRFEEYQSQVYDVSPEGTQVDSSPGTSESDSEETFVAKKQAIENQLMMNDDKIRIPLGIRDPFLSEDSQAEPWRIRAFLEEVLQSKYARPFGEDRQQESLGMDPVVVEEYNEMSTNASAGDGLHSGSQTQPSQVPEDLACPVEETQAPHKDVVNDSDQNCEKLKAKQIARPLAKRARTNL
ncbi:unnamed protein product [Cladocopium goreaui]|uniref:Uncharacterized protein n=1 Tax=Cladocopium goreaui TaxID=2562237 RepID=A0A9P1BIR9_9DINO|nr:unnamed protein product [Cladocopium goreaui]